MALKSSQPRRSASLKSDRAILRMTNGVALPKACGSGFTMLSEYCVAMAAVSLARGRRGDNGALKSRVSAPCAKIAIEPSAANQVQRKAASPDESGRDLCGEFSATEAKMHARMVELCPAHVVCCVAPPNDWCRLMLARLHGIGHYTRQTAGVT